MSVDSKLFVTCGEEKALAVGSAVKEALGVYVREKAKAAAGDVALRKFLRSPEGDRYSNFVEVTGGFEMFGLVFGNGDGEAGDATKRMLRMHTNCSCDHEDTYKGAKVIFSIGCWGSYEEVMEIVAEAVAPFGDVYYDHNDCDDEDFVKL